MSMDSPEEQEKKIVKIFYKDKDITDLVKETQDAIRFARNITVVGPTVSGSAESGFMVN